MSRLRWPDSTNSVSEKPGTIHENDDSAAGLVCMSWTATGTRTTATWNA